MRRAGGILLASVLFSSAGTLEAQSYRFDIGVNGGASLFTTMMSSDETGGSTVKFKPGWVLGSQATLWVLPRVGVRGNVSYADRGLDGDALVASSGDPNSFGHTNLWNVTADLLFRLRRPSMEYRDREWLPYVALGAGIRYLNPGGDAFNTIDAVNLKTWDGVPFTVSDGNGRVFFLGELSNPMFLGALGSDLRLSPHMALRFEVGDRMSRPRIYEVEPVDTRQYSAIDGETNQAKMMHELYGTLGLHLTIGGAGRVARVVAPPPPPPAPTPTQTQTPPTPPPPTPAPAAPTEEAISICVIDPAAPGGVRTVSAMRSVQTRDTTVTSGGSRVAFRTTVPTVAVIGSADWYVAGRPLEIALPRSTARFLAGDRSMAQSSVVLLGSVRGIPVYAERSALGTSAARFEQLNASSTAQLETVLRTDAQLRTTFESLRTLYAPGNPVGCMFYSLQLQEEVRKSGK